MILIAVCAATVSAQGACAAAKEQGKMTKLKDIVIYEDKSFYSAFPSLVVRKDGEILCAFRRAPNRKLLWGGWYTHTDANSYLVLVRSKDGGKTWTKDPSLIFAHPLGGSQDPCMVQLKDGSIVCTSYAWAMLPQPGQEKMAHPPFSFLGGYILRSDDGGKSWLGPFAPPPLPGDTSKDALGNPCPTFNRGAMIQMKDGRLLWAVVQRQSVKLHHSSVHLIESKDRAETWTYICPIAQDNTVAFNETSLIETPKGDIVAFLRTDEFDGKAAVARSTADGKSFQPWEDGKFFGHPFHMLRLPDRRVLLVYGYRQAPFGIRARVLNPECTDFAEAEEIVLRDDAGNSDIGYPWAAMLPNGDVLVSYYFNIEDGPRHIAGTILRMD